MVMLVSKRPVVTINDEPVAASERPIRTQAVLPPVRFTHRGRMMVTGVSALLIGALSVGLATAAQATRGGSGSSGKYVAKVAVRSGQTLWSLAEAYDPDADTRLVVQEIQQLNSMTGDRLQPGEVLWVPRG
jgi:nucleoid-associated protein YgaU